MKLLNLVAATAATMAAEKAQQQDDREQSEGDKQKERRTHRYNALFPKLIRSKERVIAPANEEKREKRDRKKGQ